MSSELIVPGTKVQLVRENRTERIQRVVQADCYIVKKLAKLICVRIETPDGNVYRNVSARSLRPA